MKDRLTILITGAGGLIGKSLVNRLASFYNVVGLDITEPAETTHHILWEQSDLTDRDLVSTICDKYSPDVVIHCAGIAHQKIGIIDTDTYFQVNSIATETLAKAAVKSNPAVHFIFFSSVSVYGEKKVNNTSRIHETEEKPSVLRKGMTENGECRPSSDYAMSKLDAEKRLMDLFDQEMLQYLIILRLAAVYDQDWRFNLDRRVMGPSKIAYIRFGSGTQKISALARPNLTEFVLHILQSSDIHRLRKLKSERKSCIQRNDEIESWNDKYLPRKNKNTPWQNLQIFNVCDADPYVFNTIIDIFKKSGIYPKRPVISVPLVLVWVATRIAAFIYADKKNWIHSCYDKVANDLLFDNSKMMKTGFKPAHTLETIMANSKSKSM